jgi:hypothetical protein
VTIKVIIRNEEQRELDGKKVVAPLYVQVIEGILVEGKATERKTVETIEPGCAQVFHVYAMRSLLLFAHVKP